MGTYPRDDVDETAIPPATRAERRDRATADTRAAILAAARERLLAVGYANLSTRAVAEAAEVPAQPDPLPLRQQAAAHPGRPRRRERAAARAPARDVRRSRTAVATMGARLRLPRRGPRVRLRSGPPGDDRRRLVGSRCGRRRSASSSAAGTSCSPRWRRASAPIAAGSGPSCRRRSRRSWASRSSAQSRRSCSASPRPSCPIRSALRKLGEVIRTLEEGGSGATRERSR